MSNSFFSKGIILAGGSGTRLYPITLPISKQLLPIFNKPMIHYSLSVLMKAQIRDILLITTREALEGYELLLKDGSNFGINIQYCVQDNPNGLAEAFIIGERFINNQNVCMILGDNFFYGSNISQHLQKAASQKEGATLFGKRVSNPNRFGVIDFKSDGSIKEIIEKPPIPTSNCAVTGLYFYDSNVSHFAKQIKPSKRGELEITDLNNIYLKENLLKINILPDEFIWLDTGTTDSLVDASQIVRDIELSLGRLIGCPEEIAFSNGWISRDLLLKQSKLMANSNYGKYLLEISEK